MVSSFGVRFSHNDESHCIPNTVRTQTAPRNIRYYNVITLWSKMTKLTENQGYMGSKENKHNDRSSDQSRQGNIALASPQCAQIGTQGRTPKYAGLT